MIFLIILPNSVYFQHQEYIYPYIFGTYKMLKFKAYTGQRIGLSISIIYLHSNECKLVIEMEDFILVLPYFHKSAIWAHCVTLLRSIRFHRVARGISEDRDSTHYAFNNLIYITHSIPSQKL